MVKGIHLFTLMMLVWGSRCEGQDVANLPQKMIQSDTIGVGSSPGPARITRNIIQDRKGNIWMAAFDGAFRYDGRSFANITSKVSSARFFPF